MDKKLVIGPVHTDLAAGGSLRALITGAALAQYEVNDPATTDLEKVPSSYSENSERLMTLRSAAIATDPLWRQTFAALSVGPIEFGRFEMERIQLALLWPSLFKNFVDELQERYGCSEVEIHIVGDTDWIRANAHTILCGVTIRFDTAWGYKQ